MRGSYIGTSGKCCTLPGVRIPCRCHHSGPVLFVDGGVICRSVVDLRVGLEGQHNESPLEVTSLLKCYHICTFASASPDFVISPEAAAYTDRYFEEVQFRITKYQIEMLCGMFLNSDSADWSSNPGRLVSTSQLHGRPLLYMTLT